MGDRRREGERERQRASGERDRQTKNNRDRHIERPWKGS